MKSDKRKAWGSWIVWIFVILILSGMMNGEQKVSATVEEDGLTFKTDSGFTTEVKWDEISDMEVREHFSYGTMMEGTDNGKEKSGIWTNEELGEYELAVNAKVSNCIVCRTDSGRVLVFNFESEESTRSLYEAAQEMMSQT